MRGPGGPLKGPYKATFRALSCNPRSPPFIDPTLTERPTIPTAPPQTSSSGCRPVPSKISEADIHEVAQHLHELLVRRRHDGAVLPANTKIVTGRGGTKWSVLGSLELYVLNPEEWVSEGQSPEFTEIAGLPSAWRRRANPTGPSGREWFREIPFSNPILPLRGRVYPSP